VLWLVPQRLQRPDHRRTQTPEVESAPRPGLEPGTARLEVSPEILLARQKELAMARPTTLPPKDAYKHGTRARYTVGCRCKPCTKSNADAYHDLQKKAKEAALKLKPRRPVKVTRKWTKPDGTTGTRTYKNGCPGFDGKCLTRSFLRSDSVGGICGKCRLSLVWNGLVSAEKSKNRLLKFSAQGVGRRVIGAISGVALTVLADVKSGKKKQVRANTEKAILAIDFSDLPPKSLEKVRALDRIAEAQELSDIDIQSRIGKALQGCE